ncbi:glycosyltransferase family 4 protein [Christiangramia sp. LLG6405-1]|uniref:glycosyltransferase family 4 protein n=1 Tax=Christiangramia sp. LLG6405-1 TaxID=3160832 RepID=UPI003869419B
MHIGFITPEYPHYNSTPSGGLGTSIKNLATSLVDKEINVSVFIYGQQKDHNFKEDGINFHFIKQGNYSFFGWFRYRKFLESYINRSIVRDNIDLIEAPDWTGITAFIKLSCPLLIRMNGSDAYFCYMDGRKQKLKNRFFEKTALKSADALISVSEFTAEKTKELFKLNSEIAVIPNSIEIDLFKPAKIKGEGKTILYFGTFIRKKGVLELAVIFNEVVIKHPETELWSIGKDVVDIFERRSTLELFQEKLSPLAKQQFKFLPEVTYSEIKEHVAEAAVIVLPSFAEAMPMTWLEAMAMEKALVTSNIGWAKEVMEDEVTGFTVNPKDHNQFAEKVLFLLNNPEKRKQMGKAARKKIQNEFATKVVVERNINFYKNQLQRFHART